MESAWVLTMLLWFSTMESAETLGEQARVLVLSHCGDKDIQLVKDFIGLFSS